jgi:hypothetical protein
MVRQPQLFAVAHTPGSLRLFLGLGQRGQQHGRQDRNNRDDHEELNEGEARVAAGKFSGPVAGIIHGLIWLADSVHKSR